MSSTQTVSVISKRIEMLQAERELLFDDLAESKLPLRQMLVDAKITAVDAELDYLIEKKNEYE